MAKIKIIMGGAHRSYIIYHMLLYISVLIKIVTFLFSFIFYHFLFEVHYAISFHLFFGLSGRLWDSPEGKDIINRSPTAYDMTRSIHYKIDN